MKEDKKEKLIATAQKLFEEKGYDGVRMRELSERAGVNKGLLHYYFKSKEAIFHEVFIRKAGNLYFNFENILKREDIDFEEKIKLMVDGYFNLLTKSPKLPIFILSELNKHPKLLEQTKLPESIQGTIKQLSIELNGKGSDIDAFQFLLSIISLCVFPFVMKPMLEAAMNQQMPGMDIQQFSTVRKKIIVITLIKSIK
jgi:TetR/AcrR family transcriptional regulator